MKLVLKWSESSCRAGLLGFSDSARAIVDDAEWDPETNSVMSPWAAEGIDHYSETQGAVFEALGVNFEDIDLSEMIDGNNRQSTAEDEARELLILQNNLPANGLQRKVGASGASV